LRIRIFYDKTNYRLRGSKIARQFIQRVIRNEGKVSGDLNFIFTSDEELRKINIEYLEHDYFTDVITFDNSEGHIISGEIYISIETVKFNANNYNVSLKDEVLRVMIHGVLHLLGYDDKTEIEISKMREMEGNWLEIFKQERNDI
jgi:probable rRNA maturation factor